METIRTISCKILVTPEQAKHIDATLKAFADACNYVSQFGKENKISAQFKLHKACYKSVREKFKLSANLAVRAIARVSPRLRDKDPKKRNSIFKPTSIDYDARIFSIKLSDNLVSLTLLNSRAKFFLQIGKYQREALQGKSPTSAQLVKRGKEFFLNIQIKEDCPAPFIAVTMLGVDLGIKDIATLSNGESFSSEWLNDYRLKRHRVRRSLQSKASKGKRSTRRNARRVLKRLGGKQQRATKNINHTIAKRIVDTARALKTGISIEDLTGIRERTNKRLRKSQRGLHNTWSFYQLRKYIIYKAARLGVPVVLVNPAYTSKMCSKCLHIGLRKGKKFSCSNCGNAIDADLNGALNIAAVGASVNTPENSRLFCNLHQFQD